MPLDPKKLKAVEALLAGKTVAEAAVIAGASASTVHRWCHEPDFKAEVKAGRGRGMARAAAEFDRGVEAAAKRLGSIATNPKTKTPTAITAIDKYLTQSRAFHELVNVAEQIAELRAKVEALENSATREVSCVPTSNA